MQMSSKKKVFAVAITTVALTAGSLSVAGAASKSAKISKTSITSVANMAGAGKIGRGEELSALLADLVTKGTITKAQADAIIAAHTAADAARDALRPQGGKGGFNGGPMADKLAIVSSTLGIDSTTVLTRLKAGETLAAIAGTKKAALIAALVADETKKIDAAVTAGKLTAAQATTLKAGLVAHVTAEVEATAPVGGPMGDKGGRGHGGRGHGGPEGGMGMGGAPVIPAPTTSGSAA
jgi:polyhydroxyalkanoate synthesis regulator phasin